MDLGLSLTTATATATATNNPSYIRFLVPSYAPTRSSTRTRNVSFPFKKPSKKFLVRASNDDLNFDENEQLHLKFGRLMGEDPKLTLAKIKARRLNPDVSYLEVENSFNKRKGKSVEIKELPFDVERRSTSSLNGLNLVRPVPKKGVKFEADNKPIKADVRNASQLVRKPVNNARGSLPNVILRKPTTLNEDDIGPQTSSESRIELNSLVEMANSHPERARIDNKRVSPPTVVLRKPTTLNDDDIVPKKSSQLRIKPNSISGMGNSQSVETGVDNTRGSLPNVVLRKPNTFNEDESDDIAPQISSHLRIEQKNLSEMGKKEMHDSLSDITLLRKPDLIGGKLNINEKQESDGKAKVKGVDNFEDDSQNKASIATEAANIIRILSQPTRMEFSLDASDKQESCDDHEGSDSGDDFKVNSLEVVDLSAGKVNTVKSNYAESAEFGNASLQSDFGLKDFSTTGLQPLEQSDTGSSEKIRASETYLVDSNMKCSVDATLQGKPERLDQGVKATSNLSRRERAMSNPESCGNVCELENFLATSPIKEQDDIDWKRMKDLIKTGEREKVEVISSSISGFVVSFGSLIGFLPYRDVAHRWKFVAFESWLRGNGIDPSKYKHNLGVIGKDGIANDLDSSLGPEIGQNVDVDISPDMAMEDLLRIYNNEKLKYLSFFVGQKMLVHVVLADRNSRRLIFSGIPKVPEKSIEKKRNLMAKLSIGDVVKCRITKVNYFGIFVEVEGVNALIHQTEVSWDTTLDPGSYFKIGQAALKSKSIVAEEHFYLVEDGYTVEAKVHRLDFSTDRIHLSLKEMPDQLSGVENAIIGEHDSLDGRSEAAQPNVEWNELESLIKELQLFERIQSVSKGRFFLSPGLAPTFQVYMASMIENEYKLLARSGNKVQELIIQTTLGKEEVKSAILTCTERVG